jgi:hypothetical protein
VVRALGKDRYFHGPTRLTAEINHSNSRTPDSGLTGTPTARSIGFSFAGWRAKKGVI